MRCVASLAVLWSALAFPAPIRLAFDWDDNVAVMSTKVYLVHRTSGVEWAISSAEFSRIRMKLGVPGTPYELFLVTNDFERGSHRDFADLRGDGENRFLSHLKMARPGPQWEAFVEALSRPETAAETGIVSNRMHDPETIMEGLRWLQEQGRIRYLPPLENLWCVRNPNFPTRFRDTFGDVPDGVTADGPLRKVLLLERNIERVVAAGGRSWRYSDDDLATFQSVRKRWQIRMDRGDWPRLTLELEYTGELVSQVRTRRVILRSSQSVRNRHGLVSFARACGGLVD